ncbi:MAG: hypothetical protein QMD94_00405 [Candidatus Omnitrophota bacterium]|nr:hypothetical protein [Candidatus Omnitrophota bacterium]
MKKIHININKFSTKVTFILMLSLFFVMTLSNFLIYKFSLDSQFNQVRRELMGIAHISTLMFDADLISQVPLNKNGINSPAFKIITEELNKIKEVNPIIEYIYIMGRTDQEGVLKFIVDPEPVVLKGRKKFPAPTSYPGDTYDAGNIPEMLKAFSEPSADKKLTADAWGFSFQVTPRLLIKTVKHWQF